MPAAAAAQTTLNGEVSGALTIFLRQGGVDVTHLQPGPYRFTINDASTQHNFRLTGPGIEERTPIETMVNVTWDLDLSSGLYHYNCEHHAQMFGDFTVGDVLWVEAMGSGMGKVTSTGRRELAVEPRRGVPGGIRGDPDRHAQLGLEVPRLERCVLRHGRVHGDRERAGRGPGELRHVGRRRRSRRRTATPPAAISRVVVSKTKEARIVRVTLRVQRGAAVTAQLRKAARVLTAKTARLAPGTRVVKLTVPKKAKAGAYTLRLALRDLASGDRVRLQRSVRVPR